MVWPKQTEQNADVPEPVIIAWRILFTVIVAGGTCHLAGAARRGGAHGLVHSLYVAHTLLLDRFGSRS